MTSRTPKDDFMAFLRGEMPESVPYFSRGIPLGGKENLRGIGPKLFEDTSRSPQGGYDIWGVKYVANEETGVSPLPEPNNFMFTNIADWRDYVKAPEVPEIEDWDAMAKEDYEKSGIDRNMVAVMVNGGYSPFQQLVAFMGFENALCAMFEDPYEVKALLNYMADFFVPIIEKTLDAYKPDLFYIADDTASQYNPFFSVEMYKDIFKPVYEKICKPANDRCIIIGFHNCGRCEDFLDDMLDFGVRFWEPAEPTNDLLAIKAKYGNKLSISGGWKCVNIPNWPNVTDEEIAQSVRDAIDKYAPGGGYAFCGGVLGAAGDDKPKRRQSLVRETAMEYGKDYYKK